VRFIRSRKISTGLDMSPMIDCILQLLIFFMLTSSFSSGVIRLALPRAVAAESSESRDIVISVDADGGMFLGVDPVRMEELVARLRRAQASCPESMVVFRGDENIPYRIFVEVTDRVRQAGIQRYRIAHAPPVSSP
jgi:biopolymer transport protein ExbD